MKERHCSHPIHTVVPSLSCFNVASARASHTCVLHSCCIRLLLTEHKLMGRKLAELKKLHEHAIGSVSGVVSSASTLQSKAIKSGASAATAAELGSPTMPASPPEGAPSSPMPLRGGTQSIARLVAPPSSPASPAPNLAPPSRHHWMQNRAPPAPAAKKLKHARQTQYWETLNTKVTQGSPLVAKAIVAQAIEREQRRLDAAQLQPQR